MIFMGASEVNGSSPRAWGTPAMLAKWGAIYRFIPTGVGNTRPWSWASTRWPVHPHGRGEHKKTRLAQLN